LVVAGITRIVICHEKWYNNSGKTAVEEKLQRFFFTFKMICDIVMIKGIYVRYLAKI